MREVEWERPPLLEPMPDRELERWAQESGMPRLYPLRFFTRCPWLARSMVRLSNIELAYLDHEIADLAVLVVSRDNSCRFCYAGARILLRAAGMSGETIESLEGELVSAELDPRQRSGLEFARRLSRSNPPPSRADFEALREAGFTREEILELSFVTAQYVVINRATTLLALSPEPGERLDRAWVVRLLRPLMARLIRKRHVRRAPVSLSEEEKCGPFASEVNGFDGLPAGPTLRAILDEAWASEILTRRAKALAFAVVARGLGAKRVEGEALERLAAEGMDPADAEAVMAHLASPALTPVESALVSFVRETIWYEPAPLQRRARELRGTLSDEELLEAIGLASYANAVCRLSRVLEAIG
jgi:AhpD family alkylhydroperoxidase